MIAVVIGALLGSAPASAQTDDDFAYEIVIYGEAAERQARWDVIIALKRLGWEPVDTTTSETVFKPPRRWLGRAVLGPDGSLDFRYRAVALKKVKLAEVEPVDPNPHFANEPGMVLDDGSGAAARLPAGQAGLWFLPRRALVDRVADRTRRAVREEQEQYARVRRDTEVFDAVESVPRQLDALWSDGVPLLSDLPASTPQHRKAQALAYWASRPDTFEGRQVTLAVEAWIANTLQDSEHPVTPEEKARAESLRSDGRTLSL